MKELVVWGLPKSAPNVDPIYYRGTPKKGNMIRGFRLRGGRLPGYLSANFGTSLICEMLYSDLHGVARMKKDTHKQRTIWQIPCSTVQPAMHIFFSMQPFVTVRAGLCYVHELRFVWQPLAS